MEESKDLNLSASEHNLDVNENTPSLNFSSSIGTINDSFLINEESENFISESKTLTAEALISSSLSSPIKNALIDSGFHCENLEKIVLPDLVNNSLNKSVDNEFDNANHDEKQVSDVLVNSNNDNIEISTDESLNTTTKNLASLFERLNLNSDGNVSACENLNDSVVFESNAISDEIFNNSSVMPSSLNQLLSFDKDKLKLESPKVSVSVTDSVSSISLQEHSGVPELNKVPSDETFNTSNSIENSVISSVPELNQVPFDETFTAPPSVEGLTGLSPKLNKVPQDETFPSSLSSTGTSPQSNEVPQDETYLSTVASVTGLFPQSHEVPQDETFPSSVSSTGSFPQLNEVPQDKTFLSSNPVNITVNNDLKNLESQPSETNNSDSPFPSEISHDVIFKHPLPVPEFSNESNTQNANDNVPVGNPDDNLDGEEFQDAVQFFKEPSPFQVFENTASSTSTSGYIPRDSLYMNFDPLFKKVVQPVKPFVIEGKDKGGSVKKEINDQFVKPISNIPNRISLGKLISFDSPIKSNSSENLEEKNDNLNKENSDNENKEHGDLKESALENVCDVGNDENNQSIVNKQVSNRLSLLGNLLSFDSPIRTVSARNSENYKASSEENKKFYSEEELQKALKIYELTMQESFLKMQKEIQEEASKRQGELEEKLLIKQKEVEEALEKQHEIEREALKKQAEFEKESESAKKLHNSTELCKVLHELLSEFGIITSEQNAKIGDLSVKITALESENQQLTSNLKTSQEELQSTDNMFSDFHKRYVQCKDMLKSYKSNEDQLKTQVESLNKRLEEQEQMNNMLQAKMGEVVDKANAEITSAKKGVDAQVAVLKAQLKKSELKVSSLESDLKQVKIENDKLSSICDDLMAKVSEA